MKRQFLRLFLAILVSLLLIAWATESFFIDDSPPAAEVNATQIMAMLQQDNSGQVRLNGARVLSYDSLSWPAELKQKLQQGEIVSLSNIDDKVFYYQLMPATAPVSVMQIGPFEPVDGHQDAFGVLSLTLVFYGVFALVLFIWLWPLFKDVIHLIQATNKFSSQREPIQSSVKRTSVMHPLAASVESMSRQIVRFLSLQRFLASSLSHDIRTPLSRIGFLLAMTDKSNIDEHKARIEADLDEIDKLTDDFIEFARLEELHHQLNIKYANVLDWLPELVDKVQHAHKLAFSLDSQGELGCHHDANFLRRAVQNLIMNAVKYAETQVQVIAHKQANYLVISVEDDGSGINPEEKERLIGLYERGKSPKNGGSGYGIGLAFVNVIAEWHGGYVQINQSRHLKGASVSLHLPL